MKLPTSSSIFLATLAISSSSSCLAAPTGDASTGQSMTPSSSCSHLDGASPEAHMQPRSDGYANVEARDGGGDGLSNAVSGIPILGPLLAGILEENSNPSPEQLSALKGAVAEVSRAVSTAGGVVGSTPAGAVAGPVAAHLPGPAGGVAGGVLGGDSNGGAGGASAAAPSQTASAAAADAAPSAPQPPQAPAAPAAPSLPVSPPISPPGPPNTPSPP